MTVMKRVILTVVLTMIVATASFRAQVRSLIYPGQPASKEINFYIKAPEAYRAAAYAEAQATLNISLLKVKRRKTEVIWQNEYPAVNLNELAGMKDALHQMVRINNLLGYKEQVMVYYTVTYQSDSSMLEVAQ